MLITKHLSPIQTDIAFLREDVTFLKEDITLIKKDVALIKEDVKLLGRLNQLDEIRRATAKGLV